jgi:polyhydroxyalkanoate synthesis repressor PhaR
MPPQPVVIKKYENRRLYDTSNSRYVNLEEIAQMVREGTEVRVIDAVTGDDLTRLVLTQIIVENAKAPNSAFPLDMLRQMIMASGRLSQEGLRAYMEAMLEMYNRTYQAFTPGISPFDFGATHGPEPVARTSRAAAPPEATATRAEARSDSVDSLRQRIEDLERLIAQGAMGPSSRRGKRGTSNKA